MNVLLTVLAATLLLSTASLGQPRDLRTVELVDFDCSSEIGRRRMTLFATLWGILLPMFRYLY